MVQNNYVIENDIEDSDKPVIQKKMRSEAVSNSKLPEGYEIVQKEDPRKKAANEIIDAAKSEGYYYEDYLGGEGATPQEVIDALTGTDQPERVEELKKKDEEKRVNNLKKVIATRDLLFGRLNQTKEVTLEVDGQELVFIIRRLSESENNSLINKTTLGKPIDEMTEEEFYDSMTFRRKFLARTIVEPHLTEDEWSNQVDNALVVALHERVAEVITSLDDSEGF